MRIIKLGGSLLGSPELAHWLTVLAQPGKESTVIVPGGSLFADAVREAQKMSGIGDAHAHCLAVLAMDQFGILLAAMNPALSTASSAEEIAQKTAHRQAVIWLPSRMVLADESIPTNWQVTSDSLSAWLAKELKAEQLVLIKSYRPAEHSGSLRQLILEGLIDACFTEFTAQSSFDIRVLSKHDFPVFKDGTYTRFNPLS